MAHEYLNQSYRKWVQEGELGLSASGQGQNRCKPSVCIKCTKFFTNFVTICFPKSILLPRDDQLIRQFISHTQNVRRISKASLLIDRNVHCRHAYSTDVIRNYDLRTLLVHVQFALWGTSKLQSFHRLEFQSKNINK